MKIGDKVNYCPGHVEGVKTQDGIIKAQSTYPNQVFVVYNCDDDWANYKNYTAELTYIADLMPGWKEP